MWVVWNRSTGWSDESMRFATRQEATDWIDERGDEFGDEYGIRYEP